MALGSALRSDPPGQAQVAGADLPAARSHGARTADGERGKAGQGIEADLWGGLTGPANLPPAVVERLSATLRDILADPSFKESEARAGNVLAEYADAAAFGAFMALEEGVCALWRPGSSWNRRAIRRRLT